MADPVPVSLQEQPEPFLTPPGWVASVFVRSVGIPTYRVLTYADGVARFEHRCNRGERGTVVCAPALRLSEPDGHRITQTAPLTIEPSILCPDCGTHGFIREGRWTDV